MKRIIIFFLALSCFLMAEAQYLVSEASLWSCVETNTSGTPDPNFYWVKFSGDTIINNVEYKHILRSPDSLKSHWLTVGYMREDSIGRVYKIDNYFKDEVLSFDFSLQEGDSLHVWGDFYYYVDSTALKPFGLDASPRKHIYFKWTTWIEGVASVSGPLWGLEYEDYVGVYPELICYFEDGELVYHNEKFSSCFPKVTSASALASAPPQLRVTPRNGLVHFHAQGLDTRHAQLQIIDITGRLVANLILAGELEWEVPIGGHPPGVYIYKLNAAGGVLAGKFYVR